MIRESFGQEAARLIIDLLKQRKESGEPRAMARENLEPVMVKLLDDLASRRKLEKKQKKAAEGTAEAEEIWLCELEQKPAYRGIDVRRELGKCQTHFQTRGISVSRIRFVNWLNRAQPIMLSGSGKTSFPTARRGDPYTEPPDWRTTLLRLPYDPERLKEFAAMPWSDVPLTVRQEIVK